MCCCCSWGGETDQGKSMEGFVYKEYLPENAEVIVDYTKPPKDRVAFNYVKKRNYWQAIFHGGYASFANLWNRLFGKSFYLIMGMGLGLLITDTPMTINSLPIGIFIFLGAFLFYYWVPIIATFIAALNPELISRMIPKMNYTAVKLAGLLKTKKVQTSDITDNKFIISRFSNIYLDWNVIGDFENQLEKVEVLAIPTDYEWLTPKRKKPEVDEYNFRAVFYFKKTPTNGLMQVIWY
jgi:hypothetical protein